MLFVGFSIGGALAQVTRAPRAEMRSEPGRYARRVPARGPRTRACAPLGQVTAQRVACDRPDISEGLHVLALGATQWANDPMRCEFERTFGDRAVLLATAYSLSGVSLLLTLRLTTDSHFVG